MSLKKSRQSAGDPSANAHGDVPLPHYPNEAKDLTPAQGNAARRCVVHWVCAFGFSRTIAEEATAKVFLKWHRVGHRRNPIAWLRTQAVCFARNEWNKQARRTELLSRVLAAEDTAPVADAPPEQAQSDDRSARKPLPPRAPGRRVDLAAVADRDIGGLSIELAIDLRDAIDGLPDDARVIFELIRKGQTAREVGQLLDLSVGTVRRRRAQAMTLLRARLAVYMEV